MKYEIAFSIFLSACAFKGSHEPVPVSEAAPQQEAVAPPPVVVPPSPETPVVAPTVEPTLELAIKEYDAANSYGVALSWTDPGKVQAVMLRRVDSEGRVAQLDTLTTSERTFEDKSIAAGMKYRYELRTLTTGEEISLRSSASIEIPVDLEFGGNAVLGSIDRSIHRVFFGEGAQLHTDGQNIAIQVNEIVARNATIESLPAGITAAQGYEGRFGGTIYIRAQKGRGRLNIIARGGNGGSGYAGSSGGQGGPGGPGTGGRSHRSCDPLFFSTLRFLQPLPPGGGCAGGFYCDAQPGNGQPGGQGLPGTAGTVGYNGGDSSQVMVEIKEPGGLEVQAQSYVGAGGPGGPGGAGGQGGPGGPPGPRDSRNACNAAGPGPQGAGGLTGAAGAPGREGNKQPICIRLGQAAWGDCSSF